LKANNEGYESLLKNWCKVPFQDLWIVFLSLTLVSEGVNWYGEDIIKLNFTVGVFMTCRN